MDNTILQDRVLRLALTRWRPSVWRHVCQTVNRNIGLVGKWSHFLFFFIYFGIKLFLFFYGFRYIVGQAVIDRRHADDKSPRAEHIGLHVALRSLYDDGVPVHEIVTDEHSQVVADFSKYFTNKFVF